MIASSSTSFALLRNFKRATKCVHRQFNAAVLHSYEGGLKVEHVREQTPRSHEVLVKVETAGVNYTDLMMIQNRHYRQPSQLPFTPGTTSARTVERRFFNFA